MRTSPLSAREDLWLEAILCDGTLRPVHKIVGAFMLLRSDRRSAEACVAIPTMAELLRLDERTVRSSLQTLVGAYWIEIVDPGGGRCRPTVYKMRTGQ